jgi:hypothetical protein
VYADVPNPNNYEYYKRSKTPKPAPAPKPAPGPTSGTSGDQSLPAGQRALAAAIQSRRGVNFIEVQDAKVIDVLPDDLVGSQHQKWVVELENGATILSVFNLDICERVPLKIGDRVSMGGQFIWDKGGGLIHWIHKDPRGNRPDGYVELNGVRYGNIINNN